MKTAKACILLLVALVLAACSPVNAAAPLATPDSSARIETAGPTPYYDVLVTGSLTTEQLGAKLAVLPFVRHFRIIPEIASGCMEKPCRYGLEMQGAGISADGDMLKLAYESFFCSATVRVPAREFYDMVRTGSVPPALPPATIMSLDGYSGQRLEAVATYKCREPIADIVPELMRMGMLNGGKLRYISTSATDKENHIDFLGAIVALPESGD